MSQSVLIGKELSTPVPSVRVLGQPWERGGLTVTRCVYYEEENRVHVEFEWRGEPNYPYLGVGWKDSPYHGFVLEDGLTADRYMRNYREAPEVPLYSINFWCSTSPAIGGPVLIEIKKEEMEAPPPTGPFGIWRFPVLSRLAEIFPRAKRLLDLITGS